MKQIRLLILAVSLTVANSAQAQTYFTGQLEGRGDLTDSPLPYSLMVTSTSFTLSPTNLVLSSLSTGTFAGIPNLSDAAGYTGTVSGLSSSPTPEDINDFLLLASPGPGGVYNGAGTTPANEFDFTLTSVTTTRGGYFSGTGIFHDETGTYANTEGTFDVNYSQAAPEYDFAFYASGTPPTPVPEPSTIGLLAAGLTGTLAYRRRKV